MRAPVGHRAEPALTLQDRATKHLHEMQPWLVLKSKGLILYSHAICFAAAFKTELNQTVFTESKNQRAECG